jgi:hypothetical protein
MSATGDGEVRARRQSHTTILRRACEVLCDDASGLDRLAVRQKPNEMKLLYPNVIWRVPQYGHKLHAIRNRYALDMGCGSLCANDMRNDRAPPREERRTMQRCSECVRESGTRAD